MITWAIFFCAIWSYIFVTYVNHGWQIVQAFLVVPPIVMTVMASHVYESPKWLIGNGRIDEGREVVRLLRADDHDVEEEIDEILREKKDEETSSGDMEATWAEVFKAKRALIIGCGLMFFSAMTGVNSVIFYSTKIFSFAGFDQAILATTSVGFVNFIVTIVAAYLTDRYGRKQLILLGVIMQLCSLMVLVIVLSLYNSNESAQGIIAVIATLIFVSGFSVGLGPLAWVVMSEVLPTRLRSKAYGLFLSINWGSNLLIAMLTLTTINGLGDVDDSLDDDDRLNSGQKQGVAYLDLLFGCVCAFAVYFVYFIVPETKGKTVEQLSGIESSLLESLNLKGTPKSNDI
jgi:sugar porter (SP) family MFS transporter